MAGLKRRGPAEVGKATSRCSSCSSSGELLQSCQPNSGLRLTHAQVSLLSLTHSPEGLGIDSVLVPSLKHVVP